MTRVKRQGLLFLSARLHHLGYLLTKIKCMSRMIDIKAHQFNKLINLIENMIRVK